MENTNVTEKRADGWETVKPSFYSKVREKLL